MTSTDLSTETMRQRIREALYREPHRQVGVGLLNIIEKEAEQNPEYAAKYNHWLKEGSTVFLRDELAAPFKNAAYLRDCHADHFDAFHDAWTAIDSARLEARLTPETTGPRFQVEMEVGSTWENVWHENDEPQTFATVAEAQAEIDEFLADIADEIARGERGEDEGYSADEFRIVTADALRLSPEELTSNGVDVAALVDKCVTVSNDEGVEFKVRRVDQGDSYGLDDALTHDDPRPMIEFYDAEHEQFVSRYYLETLLERDPADRQGLCLDGGNADRWTIDFDGLRSALSRLAPVEFAASWGDALQAKERKSRTMTKAEGRALLQAHEDEESAFLAATAKPKAKAPGM